MDAENTNQDSTKTLVARVTFCEFTATIIIEDVVQPMDPGRVRSWLREGDWHYVPSSRKLDENDRTISETWEKKL